jgi:signal transduction histidine kinase
VKIEIIDNENFADVRISDSGKGIPESIKHKIMEPFFTTKPINKGTGLGLSISKNIVENHHGALLLDESAPHTTFIMRLKK